METAPPIDDPLGESGGDGETPLSPEDREALIPKHITLRRELNEVEGAGVSGAIVWARGRKWAVPTLLDPTFICGLHKRMFRDVWEWAGSYRVRDVSIVLTSHRGIPVELRKLRDDVEYWVHHETYPADEIAVRFHHRLVLIHPFPNGNGRLTRLMGDLLAAALGREPFTWGKSSVPEYRARYIEALHAADKSDIGPLLALSRNP